MLAGVFAIGGSFLDPENLVDTFGLLGIFTIIFVETGLLIGFFLPGDSLLFTAGFLASGPETVDEALHLPLGWLLLGSFVAAVAGDQVGYVIGTRVGPALFKRPDSRFFKQENVVKAQAFFDKHGAKTIVLARFVPIVRTFNVVGALLWAVGVTLLGFFLGQVDFVEQNLEVAILMVVIISVMPIVFELWKARKERKSVALDIAHDLLDPDLDDMAREAVRPDGQLD